MSSLLTYASIIQSLNKFREAGTSTSDFNRFDTPGHKYFKIFFYFNNGDVDSGAGQVTDSGGLLAPTWSIPNIGDDNYYMYNSAWSYLKMNCEDERAQNLEQFINLLSNISSESPWYFTELSGLDAALERKVIMDKDFKIEDTRSKITIKCLPDAFDDRIGTLLDLYRSIVWSWIDKREVVPANLRKFDMGVFIYETPNTPFHKMPSNSMIEMDGLDNYEYGELYDGGSYKTSYKYIEFHNCEIDYNSSKGNFSAINNADGISPEYSIDIHFDDCYETRYNEMMLTTIGDMISWDASEFTNTHNDGGNVVASDPLTQRSEYYEDGFLSNATKQLVGVGSDAVTGLVKKVALGNLYTFSLTKMADQVKSLVSGDVWSTARNITEYMNDSQQRQDNNTKVNLFGRLESKRSNPSGNPTDNLGSATPIAESSSDMGNIFPPKKIIPRVKKLGNLATSNTIANNI